MLCVQPTNPFVPFPKEAIEQSIPARFESIVRRYPARLAIKTRDQSCTYEELNRTANRVAHALLETRGSAAEPIPFLLEPSIVAIATIYGILKTGKSAVPLDVSLPDARLTAILEDVQPNLLVTDHQHSAFAETLAAQQYQVLNLDTLAPTLSSLDNPGLVLSADTLAYILYTSGSTGQPKGVMQNHRNTLHNCMQVTNRLHLSADDRIALFASLSTGQGMIYMFRGLLNGAALYPWPLKQAGLNSLATWLMEEGITIYWSSATVFRAFIDSLTGRETFPTLRLIRVGSESVSTRDVERYKAHFPPYCLLLNSLASTETMTTRMYVMNHETPLTDGRVPVGYAVDDVDILLWDEHDREVGINQPGEIVVKGRYLSPGYWRQPDLTATAFLPDPDREDTRLYRTGDLGVMLPDGCLVHLGRKDFQVKIRGHRIEVAEVERVLHTHPSLKDVAVMARSDHTENQILAAYIVPTQTPGPSIGILQDFVQQQLPDYMVPAVWMTLDALPLTPSGKVDRQHLPVPDRIRPQLPQAYVAPQTPIEVALVKLWTEMLDISIQSQGPIRVTFPAIPSSNTQLVDGILS